MAEPATVEIEVEKAVARALDALGLPYEVLPCDPALADTEAFCAHYGIPPARSANTIVVVGKADPRRYAVCVVLATTRLDVNGAVRARLGARRTSFASPEETSALTGMLLGGVTPLALPPELPVWVDARVMEPDWVVLGGGSRSSKIKVGPQVFERLPGAEVVPGLAVERSA